MDVIARRQADHDKVQIFRLRKKLKGKPEKKLWLNNVKET